MWKLAGAGLSAAFPFGTPLAWIDLGEDVAEIVFRWRNPCTLLIVRDHLQYIQTVCLRTWSLWLDFGCRDMPGVRVSAGQGQHIEVLFARGLL